MYVSGAVELRNSLASRFNQELPSTVIFDYPNAQGLASFILGGQDKAAEAESDEDSESSQDGDWEALRDIADISAIRSVFDHYITLHYITLHYITLHYITLHYITLHYITLHYITLHYITEVPNVKELTIASRITHHANAPEVQVDNPPGAPTKTQWQLEFQARLLLEVNIRAKKATEVADWRHCNL